MLSRLKQLQVCFRNRVTAFQVLYVAARQEAKVLTKTVILTECYIIVFLVLNIAARQGGKQVSCIDIMLRHWSSSVYSCRLRGKARQPYEQDFTSLHF